MRAFKVDEARAEICPKTRQKTRGSRLFLFFGVAALGSLAGVPMCVGE